MKQKSASFFYVRVWLTLKIKGRIMNVIEWYSIDGVFFMPKNRKERFIHDKG